MIEVGKQYNITVVKLLDKGVIVSVDGEEKTQFIHISKLTNRFIRSVTDAVSIGDKYTANCIFNVGLNKPELTIRESVGSSKPDTSTLDKMIKDAEKVFADKQKSMDSRSRRRRK